VLDAQQAESPDFQLGGKNLSLVRQADLLEHVLRDDGAEERSRPAGDR
jgi:hypothetical protein